MYKYYLILNGGYIKPILLGGSQTVRKLGSLTPEERRLIHEKRKKKQAAELAATEAEAARVAYLQSIKVPDVYLALGKGPLKFPPTDFSKFIPTEDGLLKLLHKNGRYIYKIPTIQCILDLKKKYGILKNQLFNVDGFDHDLTICEGKYLDILNKYNNIEDDIWGRWSTIKEYDNTQVVMGGTGTITDNDTIILGFDNKDF